MHSTYLDLSAEVASALAAKRPVVALESTIIAHGMPYPENVKTASMVEEEVRRQGAVPATVAILGGRLKAGLSADELDHLGKHGKQIVKTSRRDLPFVVSRKLDGATTVAATMIIAGMSGIPVFATGGIGGVHRGAAASMDVSADLQELSRTNVAVVSAGAKAILDLRLTLEYLETHGVPVIGFRTGDFPAFYSRKNGLPVDYRIDEVKELAQIMKTKWKLGLHGGLLIANPIPEADALEYEAIDTAIKRAVAESRNKGITGKAITPFLLARIKELTEGKSLEANVQLVINNARLAGQLAVAYSDGGG